MSITERTFDPIERTFEIARETADTSATISRRFFLGLEQSARPYGYGMEDYLSRYFGDSELDLEALISGEVDEPIQGAIEADEANRAYFMKRRIGKMLLDTYHEKQNAAIEDVLGGCEITVKHAEDVSFQRIIREDGAVASSLSITAVKGTLRRANLAEGQIILQEPASIRNTHGMEKYLQRRYGNIAEEPPIPHVYWNIALFQLNQPHERAVEIAIASDQ